MINQSEYLKIQKSSLAITIQRACLDIMREDTIDFDGEIVDPFYADMADRIQDEIDARNEA